MVDAKILELISSKDDEYGLVIYDFLLNNGFDYEAKNMVKNYGLTTFDKIYINTELLSEVSIQTIYFVLLHETYHAKSIKKLGKEKCLEYLLNDDFEVYYDFILKEEILADRYASLVFSLLTKKSITEDICQNLTNIRYLDRYKNFLKPIHLKLKKEKNYDKVMSEFINE